jgi:hypothetical protein
MLLGGWPSASVRLDQAGLAISTLTEIGRVSIPTLSKTFRPMALEATQLSGV